MNWMVFADLASVGAAIGIGVVGSLVAGGLVAAFRGRDRRENYPSVVGGQDSVWLSRAQANMSSVAAPPMCLDPGDQSIKAALRWIPGRQNALDVQLVECLIRFHGSHDRASWRKPSDRPRPSYVNSRKEYVVVFPCDNWTPRNLQTRGGSIAVKHHVSGQRRRHYAEIRFEPAGEKRLDLRPGRLFLVWRFTTSSRVSALRYLTLKYL